MIVQDNDISAEKSPLMAQFQHQLRAYFNMAHAGYNLDVRDHVTTAEFLGKVGMETRELMYRFVDDAQNAGPRSAVGAEIATIFTEDTPRGRVESPQHFELAERIKQVLPPEFKGKADIIEGAFFFSCKAMADARSSLITESAQLDAAVMSMEGEGLNRIRQTPLVTHPEGFLAAYAAGRDGSAFAAADAGTAAAPSKNRAGS